MGRSLERAELWEGLMAEGTVLGMPVHNRRCCWGKHLLVIVGLFFCGAYSVSPLENSPNICLGDGRGGGARQWGTQLVAGVQQQLKAPVPCTAHLSVLILARASPFSPLG